LIKKIIGFLGFNMTTVLAVKVKRISDTYGIEANGISYLLTAQQGGIEKGDRIELPYGKLFDVKKIEYYSEPDDMFLAEIVRIN
jgi:hypothetical protein